MKGLKNLVTTAAVVFAFAGLVYAGMTPISGEVTKYDSGKSITLKDAKGKAHTLQITKDTKTEGEVKVGAKVTVEAEGKKAHSIKAAAAAGAAQ